jgi:hypothetical protein
MLRKLGIAFIVMAVVGSVANLQAKESDKESPLRGLLRKDTVLTLKLLQSDLIAKEIELSESQIDTIASVEEERYKSLHDKKDMKKVDADVNKELADLLNARQTGRFVEILIQAKGYKAFRDEDVVKALELSAEQKGKLKTVISDANKAILALDKPAPNSMVVKDLDIPESIRKSKPIEKDAEDKIQKILTPKQREQYSKMKGKDFDAAKLKEQVVELLN